MAEPGPGIRLAVKDLLDTAGLTTTYGSVLFADHVPDRTAESVRLLEAAGYAVVGKANLHEFAYGVTSLNPHFGFVPNPIAPGRVAGGSSGGSAAALAADLADAALGTDSGGSIRIPAACCGIVGFKPTYGLVSAEGCFPLAPSFDHVGPMARDVSACERMLGVLADGRFEPASLESLEEIEVGVAWLDRAAPLVRARVEAAAERFPRRRSIELPPPRDVWPLFEREVADVHRGLYPEQADSYGDDVRAHLEDDFAVSDAEVAAAERARSEYRERCAEALDGVDLLVTPTVERVAPLITDLPELAHRDWATRFTFPFNVLGRPALALPCGAAEHALPASVQLVGRSGEDALVLAAGRLLEQALSHPSIE
ncbi:MAG: aspartyl-tRNA(Asn)/glutamyl-tRNA(Gln) amidotransferase subunit [Gaiellaceae bacterium]|nr:aspartyl-tRNA(Asn)/glutamyl-tRNA(Gln) amidotransferase subunit [Gaiellaceae bacterium]